MTHSVLEVPDFSIQSRSHQGDSTRYLLKPGSRLVLPEPGIYTLEGDNQAGKSTLIKILMGVIPCQSGANLSLSLNGQPLCVRSVGAAKKMGFGAVFQDDPLIPTLTVGEQLVLMHGANGFKQIVSSLRLSRAQPSFGRKKLLARARMLLQGYDPSYVSILDKYPTQLSGGALALARIVSAQLQKPLAVLFMDEPFAGVQRDVWPLIVDRLKSWTSENKITILTVSHSDDEIARWQPLKRLVIRNQAIDFLN